MLVGVAADEDMLFPSGHTCEKRVRYSLIGRIINDTSRAARRTRALKGLKQQMSRCKKLPPDDLNDQFNCR